MPKRHLLALFAAAGVLAGAVVALPASAASATGAIPFCAWWVKTTPTTANVALPDAAATYWTTPFVAFPGMEIEVDGTYPNARYMSFNVYDNGFGSFTLANGVTSALADYQIDPARGTANPFRSATSDFGTYRLTIKHDPGPAEHNTLPLLPDGTDTNPPKVPQGIGFLVYRVYLPEGDTTTGLPLPALTLRFGPLRIPLPTCSRQSQTGATSLLGRLPIPAPPAPANPPDLQFFRPKASTTNSFFPNANNAYVAATVTPQRGRIVVVRGKAPVSPSGAGDGHVPVPWPDDAYQVRYWSMCTYVYAPPYPLVVNRTAGGGEDFGCRADVVTPLAGDRQYTYVVAFPADVPADATAANGVAVLPFSRRDPSAQEAIVLRNMLPNGFTNAIQNVPQDGDPQSAAATMGDYYPHAVLCDRRTFERGGADACFR